MSRAGCKALLGALIIAALPALVQAQSRDLVDDEIDRLVLDYLDTIQPLSIRENREYCGLVGFTADGEFKITKARPGAVDSCDPGADPPGFEVIASYHTHGAYTTEADTEVPSVEDLLGDIEEEIDGYVATPGGRVWLNLGLEKFTYQLCGRGCVVADPRYRPCKAFPPAVEYTLDTLRKRAADDPGRC